MRTTVGAVLTAGALAAMAVPAMPAARVQLASSQTVLEVSVVSETTRDHAMIIEPFGDDGRLGWRVRQPSLGQPAFGSQDPDCTVNPILNDVVCDTGEGRAGISVETETGDDTVRILETRDDITNRCEDLFGASEDPFPAVVDLGGGDDRLVHDTEAALCPGGTADKRREHRLRLEASGGPGDDTIRAGRFDDVLFGNAGNDDISGGGGDDVLDGSLGRDDLDGGFGDDEVRGGPERDDVTGGPGADTLLGGSHNDHVFALDGGRDAGIDCGTGIGDTLLADTADLPLFTTRRRPIPLRPALQLSRRCEERVFSAPGLGTPARLLTDRPTLRANGIVTVGIECPLGPATPCTGGMRILRGVPGEPGTVVATRTYALERGDRGFFSIASRGGVAGEVMEVRLQELAGRRVSFRAMTLR